MDGAVLVVFSGTIGKTAERVQLLIRFKNGLLDTKLYLNSFRQGIT